MRLRIKESSASLCIALLQGPPRPALTTAVLSMEAVGWMYTFPATQGSCVREAAHRSNHLSHEGRSCPWVPLPP